MINLFLGRTIVSKLKGAIFMDSFYTPSKIVDITIQNGVKKLKRESVPSYYLDSWPVCSLLLPHIPVQWQCTVWRVPVPPEYLVVHSSLSFSAFYRGFGTHPEDYLVHTPLKQRLQRPPFHRFPPLQAVSFVIF